MATMTADGMGDGRGAASVDPDERVAGLGDEDWASSADLLVRIALDDAEVTAEPPASRRRETEAAAASTVRQAETATTWPEAACDSDRAPGVALIDPVRLAREIGSGSGFSGDDGERPGSTSQEDEERRSFLRGYAERPEGLFRPHLVADDDTIARLEALRTEAPNAAALVDIVRRAALLSRHAHSPLCVPPLLIVGPPGTGKSRVARRLAEALGTALTTIDGGAVTDRGPFVGHDPGYRGSGPGQVARALLDGHTAGPLVLLDEVDKVSAYNHGVKPLNSLLSLLEPTTARSFTDTYIGLPMHAEGVLWLMTANSVSGLPAPLLDRVVTVEMPRLGRAETREALRRMLTELLGDHGLPAADMSSAALGRLQAVGLRQARRILSLALGPALAAGRAVPDASDIASAAALLDPLSRRRRGSRTPVPSRAPVGFIRFPSGDAVAPA